ncbi:MAG: hypothetical protein JSS95_07560 [Acidobacteria bacterium]|nr:hypothetical protein [Acidobacteriota bacterium]
MVCSLNCFCAFLEARTQQQRANVIKDYKKGVTGPAKGMMVYYKPALQLMRGRLCPKGTMDQKLTALREACIVASWTDKLNDARIAANTIAYRAFYSEFGNKRLKIFPNPRLQCLVSTNVAVNLQPEFFAEVDGTVMMWKFGMSKRSRSEQTIRLILQMMSRASKHKGIEVPIHQMRFFDTRTGRTYVETVLDVDFEKRLKPLAKALADIWDQAA